MDWERARKSERAFWFLLTLAVAAGLVFSFATAQGQSSDPRLAVFRFASHGASAVAIKSDANRTYFLGCAHMLEGPGYKNRAIAIYGPDQPGPKKGQHQTKLLAYDPQVDLSLSYMENGPCYYVKIASQLPAHGSLLKSIGYDEMEYPPKYKDAVAQQTSRDHTFTIGRPWHGRSGGALVNGRNELVGIVQGYEGRPPLGGPNESWLASGKGVYISLNAITRFLNQHAPWRTKQPNWQIASPAPQPQRFYQSPLSPPGGC